MNQIKTQTAFFFKNPDSSSIYVWNWGINWRLTKHKLSNPFQVNKNQTKIRTQFFL